METPLQHTSLQPRIHSRVYIAYVFFCSSVFFLLVRFFILFYFSRHNGGICVVAVPTNSTDWPACDDDNSTDFQSRALSHRLFFFFFSLSVEYMAMMMLPNNNNISRECCVTLTASSSPWHTHFFFYASLLSLSSLQKCVISDFNMSWQLRARTVAKMMNENCVCYCNPRASLFRERVESFTMCRAGARSLGVFSAFSLMLP